MSTGASSRADSLQFLTVSQAAGILAVHSSTVRRWIHDGRLPAYRIGDKGVRVVLTDVVGLARSLGQAAEKEGYMSAAEKLGILPLTEKEQEAAFAASAAAQSFREKLRQEHGDNAPQAWQLLNEAREQRTGELLPDTRS
ncbi:MAG: excisionase family DNA-binding protein [Chloroflexota bacterium]